VARLYERGTRSLDEVQNFEQNAISSLVYISDLDHFLILDKFEVFGKDIYMLVKVDYRKKSIKCEIQFVCKFFVPMTLKTRYLVLIPKTFPYDLLQVYFTLPR
jgi:hypothetical protein